MTDRIKEIIKTFFNTQVAFADYLQVSRQQVTRYLNNNNQLPLSTIISLANDYKINPTWLLLGVGNMLLSDDDKVNNNELIQHLQKQITELQADNDKLQSQVDLLKSIIQSNSNNNK